jgi:hypothetical protein
MPKECQGIRCLKLGPIFPKSQSCHHFSDGDLYIRDVCLRHERRTGGGLEDFEANFVKVCSQFVSLERLRAFFRFAQKRKWVTENPALDLKAPKNNSLSYPSIWPRRDGANSRSN